MESDADNSLLDFGNTSPSSHMVPKLITGGTCNRDLVFLCGSMVRRDLGGSDQPGADSHTPTGFGEQLPLFFSVDHI